MSDFGMRNDGKTKKGMGFLGALKNKNGEVMTEYSVGVNINGKEMDVPSLVPTLSADEVDRILNTGELTDSIVGKAVDHARQRIKDGKSPFAD